MKNLFLFIALAVTLSACKTSFVNSTATYFNEHCADCKIVKQADGKFRASGRLIGLYDTTEVAKYIDEGKITFDARKAEIPFVVVSADSIPPVDKILNAIFKGVKKAK